MVGSNATPKHKLFALIVSTMSVLTAKGLARRAVYHQVNHPVSRSDSLNG